MSHSHATRNIIELKSLPQLARAICLPGDNEPVRLPTYPAVERTSVLAFNATDTISVGPKLEPSTPLRGMLFKNSVSPLWLEQAESRPFLWNARWDAQSHSGGSTDVLVESPVETVITAIGNGNLQYPEVGSDLARVKVVPLGEFNGMPYLYLPQHMRMGVWLQGPLGQPLSGTVYFEYVTLGGELATGSTICNPFAAGGNGGSTVLPPAEHTSFVRPTSVVANTTAGSTFGYVKYVHFFVTNTSNPVTLTSVPGGLSVTYPGADTPLPVLLPAVSSPALPISPIPFSNTRTPAVSALFTNVTKALNKEGTVMAGRLNPATVNPFDFNSSSFTQLLPSEKYFYGLEQGFYTFVPMSDSLDHFRDDIYNRAGSTEQYPWLHLGDASLINVFMFNDPDGATALAVNVDWHVEYRNTSVLWPSAISSVSIENAHQLQLILLQTGFFFENPAHKLVLNALTKALAYMKRYAPAAAKAAISTVPGGAALYKGVSTFVAPMLGRPKQKRGKRRRSRLPPPQNKPKPTTLQVQTSRPKMKGGLAMYLAQRK